ncbi:MAG: hypothetical protein N2114_05290 [Candidatus Goldbacteria bacterium]|nr:hypothetical protein [Candidatus Goldiibacteriota bacterium]
MKYLIIKSYHLSSSSAVLGTNETAEKTFCGWDKVKNKNLKKILNENGKILESQKIKDINFWEGEEVKNLKFYVVVSGTTRSEIYVSEL